MQRGPVEVLVFTFGGDTAPNDVTAAIRRPVESGAIAVVDVVLVLRGPNGEPDLRDLENDLPAELAWLAPDPHTMLNDDDVQLVLDTLSPAEQAVVLAVEHVWARDVAERLDEVGAEFALHARVATFESEMAFHTTPSPSGAA